MIMLSTHPIIGICHIGHLILVSDLERHTCSHATWIIFPLHETIPSILGKPYNPYG